jgi:hypothetical protein
MEPMKVIRETGQPRNKVGWFGWRVQGTALSGVSRQPLLDACRAIKRMGGVPDHQLIALYREGSDQWDLRCGLEWGAAYDAKNARFNKRKP